MLFSDSPLTSAFLEPAGAPPLQTFTSNVISVPTTVPADNSYMVVSYLTISSDLTVLGNLGVF